MQEVLALLGNPLVWKVLVAYWVFSAFAGSMPMPKPESSEWYKFAFAFIHSLAGNVNRAAASLKVPGV